jgi:hypothetical protein
MLQRTARMAGVTVLDFSLLSQTLDDQLQGRTPFRQSGFLIAHIAAAQGGPAGADRRPGERPWRRVPKSLLRS